MLGPGLELLPEDRPATEAKVLRNIKFCRSVGNKKNKAVCDLCCKVKRGNVDSECLGEAGCVGMDENCLLRDVHISEEEKYNYFNISP